MNMKSIIIVNKKEIDFMTTKGRKELFMIFNGSCAILDGGHGWDTPGKCSPDETLRENEFNSSVVDKISMVLNLIGAKFTILCKEHNDVNLKERVKREHTLYTKIKSSGLFPYGISTHANGFSEEAPNGYEVYHHASSELGKLFATEMHKAVMCHNHRSGFPIASRKNPIKDKPLAMTKNTKSVFILTEAAFMTNPDDLRYLKQDSFRNSYALACVEGMANFLFQYKKLQATKFS